jgi:hypothetical protein
VGAEDYSVVWNAKRAASAVDLPVGAVVVKNAAGEYDLATLANRTAYGRRSAGIARSPAVGKTVTFNFQFVGIVSPDLSGLGVGAATTVSVSDAGFLQRGASGDIVGRCDADGTCYLIFGGVIGVGTATPGAPANSMQFADGTATSFVGDSSWSRPVDGNLQTAWDTTPPRGHGFIDVVLAGGDASGKPAIGLIRLSDFSADHNGAASYSIATYYRSSGGANVQQTILGISGGTGFLGDAANPLTPFQFYGAAGAPFTFVMGAGGDIFITGTHYSSLGGASTFLSIDATGKIGVATPASGGNPGGSGTQMQYRVNATTFGGASGLIYDTTNNRPQAANGYSITAGGFDMILAGTPSAARTWTFQDTTDTVVGRATTDTLTNKTVNATNNTITDTSAAVGDLLSVVSGTKFTRLAKGSNSTLLGVSSGGVVGYASATVAQGGTGLTAMPGSSSEIIINSGGTVYGTATNVTAGSSFIAVGATGASTGNIRLPNATSVRSRNAANSADIVNLATDASNFLGVGTDTALTTATQAARVMLYASGFVVAGVAGTNYLEVGSVASKTITRTQHNFGNAIGGSVDYTFPYAKLRAAITQSNTTDTTLAASQYSCPILDVSGTPGGNFNVIGPGTTGAHFIVKNATANTLTFKVSGQTGVTIATATSRQVFCDGTDYKYASG